jgi:tagatose-1,6-bisphosphate aldolase non-catalytic subunit AgaZ/GatZ
MYPRVQAAMDKMIKNLHEKALPLTLLKQLSPNQFELIGENKTCLIPEELILLNIQKVLQKYQGACSPK